MINLPVPCPSGTKEGRVVTRFRLEANNIAVNLIGTKSMLLMSGEVLKVLNVLKVRFPGGSIYTSGYKMRVIELRKGHEKKAQEICQVDVWERC